jgi:hypothetical protein
MMKAITKLEKESPLRRGYFVGLIAFLSDPIDNAPFSTSHYVFVHNSLCALNQSTIAVIAKMSDRVTTTAMVEKATS